MKQYLHYSQLVKNGRFCNFDYRIPSKNIEIYGQLSPPVYDLSKVTAPVAVHYGMNDWLLHHKVNLKYLIKSDKNELILQDAEKTIKSLSNVVVHNKIKYKQFTHGHFLWAKDVFPLLYDDIINITLRYV